jgi:hypothetical protein
VIDYAVYRSGALSKRRGGSCAHVGHGSGVAHHALQIRRRWATLISNRVVANSERALAGLHSRIRACTKCVDAGYLPSAFPIVAGKATDRVMIIGQAPGAVELTTGLPFSGRAGAELRRWLAQAGIDEAHLPYRTSITKCFPGKSASGAGIDVHRHRRSRCAHRGSRPSSRSCDRASSCSSGLWRSSGSGDAPH